jgi:peptidoglycan hydrolase CwlO-like protein
VDEGEAAFRVSPDKQGRWVRADSGYMKRKILNATLLSAALLAGACTKSENTTVTSQTEKGTASSKKVEVEYSYSQKDELVSKMKQQLADVNSEIKRLSEKVADSAGNAKEEAKPKLEALKEKAKNLDVYIDKAQNSTESTWADVKDGSRKALDDAKQGFNEARAWLAEKIAPK